MTLGLVLSGGGPRGAYEIGVLGWVLERLGTRARFDVIAGTSAGAINAAYLAGAIAEGAAAARRAAELWEQIRLSDLTGLGPRRVRDGLRAILGGNAPAGILDPHPIARLVEREIAWDALHDNLARGRLRGLSISSTRVSTGACVAFTEVAPGVPLPATFGPSVEARAVRVGPAHVLASSAIPVLFAPVSIGGELFCEGGLRLNTPLAPALYLGADRLLVLSVSAEKPGAALDQGRAPSASFLLGKVLDAFLLDHVLQDLEQLDAINALLADAEAAFGPQALERLGAEAARHGRRAPRPVARMLVRPSADLGELARDHLRKRRPQLVGELGRTLLSLLEVSGGADLASYFLFDAAFARELIALGRGDAQARGDALLDFVAPRALRAVG